MKYEFSLAHLSALSLPPPQLVEVAARAGYRHVGLRLNRVTPNEPLYALADDKALMRETKARLADTGVTVLDIELARMGPDSDARSYLPILEAGAELGAAHVLERRAAGDDPGGNVNQSRSRLDRRPGRSTNAEVVRRPWHRGGCFCRSNQTSRVVPRRGRPGNGRATPCTERTAVIGDVKAVGEGSHRT